MPAQNRKLMFNGIHIFTILLLIGLLLPAGPASAQTPIPPSPFAKLAPFAGGIGNHNLANGTTIVQTIGGNLIQDPSFEASFGSTAYWGQFSTNRGAPLCIVTYCGSGAGTAGPYMGSVWAWFGGIDFTNPITVSPEIGEVYQSVTFPSCGAALQFYFRIGYAQSGSDTNDLFAVAVDNNLVFAANATQKNSYPSYTPINVDVSSFADGSAHTVLFYSVTTGQIVNFNLDDVSLVSGNCVTISGNAGVVGATLSYANITPHTVLSDGGGNYSISVPSGWSGTITPSKTGYTFSPPSRAYANITTDQTAQDYTATLPYSITGNAGVAGVTLTYTDGSPQFVTADGSGNYSLNVPSGWSGTVTPHKIGYSFTPASKSYSNVLSNQTGQNYTAAVCASCADTDTTGVFRPSNGLLYLKNLNITGFADVAINYGLAGDYPVVGDWDGNGTATIGIYRNGSFYLRNSNTLGFADMVFAFGAPGDQPVAGDWNGDGIDSIGVYRPSTGQFLLRNSNIGGFADLSFYLGNVGDVGIAGDWNGDGVDTTGVFRPSNGVIFLKNMNQTGFADIALNYGLPGDQPVTGDWNNDGKDTIGVYRNGVFYLRNSNTIGFADLVFGLGNPGDMPIGGNWDNLP
jgi:hypothetical protein